MAQFSYPLSSAGVVGHEQGSYPNSLVSVIFSDDWETNDWSAWDVSQSGYNDTSTSPAKGSYSGYTREVDGANFIENFNNVQFTKLQFHYNEPSSFQQGGGMRIKNSNGNYEAGWATDNPQWIIDDANGQTQVDSGGSNYDDWHRVTVTFDWANATMDVDWKNQNTGRSGSWTGRPLKKGVDVAQLELWPYGGGWAKGSDHNTYWDNVTVEG